MITRPLDRARSERDRRRWNRAVRRAKPGDHATVTHIGPKTITWVSGPIRRNPRACPWPDPTPGDLTVWRKWSAGRLMVGDTRLATHDRGTWPSPGTQWLTIGSDMVPTWDPPMMLRPVTELPSLRPGTWVTVWWHGDDDLTRYATWGRVVDPEDDAIDGEILVGDPNGDAESITLDDVDAARLDFPSQAVTR